MTPDFIIKACLLLIFINPKHEIPGADPSPAQLTHIPHNYSFDTSHPSPHTWPRGFLDRFPDRTFALKQSHTGVLRAIAKARNPGAIPELP